MMDEGGGLAQTVENKAGRKSQDTGGRQTVCCSR